MEFNSGLINNPYFWFFITSIFFGLTLSRLTKFNKKNKDLEKGKNLEKEKNRKWVFVCLYFSLAILLLLAGIIFGGADKIKNVQLFIFLGILSGYFFIAFRFFKSVGLPTFFFLFSIIILFILFLQSIIAFTGETEIAKIRVINANNNKIKLEIERIEDEMPVTTTLDGDYFAPIVKVIVFDDILVFIGARTWYKFVGITSFKQEIEDGIMKYKQADTDYYFPVKSKSADAIFNLIERYEKMIPGIKTIQIAMPLKHVFEMEELNQYSLRIQHDDSLQIIWE